MPRSHRDRRSPARVEKASSSNPIGLAEVGFFSIRANSSFSSPIFVRSTPLCSMAPWPRADGFVLNEDSSEESISFTPYPRSRIDYLCSTFNCSRSSPERRKTRFVSIEVEPNAKSALHVSALSSANKSWETERRAQRRRDL